MKSTYDKKLSKYILLSILGLSMLFTACSKEEEDKTSTNAEKTESSIQESVPVDDGKGFGPVKELILTSSIDTKLVSEGKKVFEMKCFACHNIDSRKVGPALKGVSLRRKPEWIMNMIMNPAEMTQKDPTAKIFLGEYMTQMANQNVDEKSARAILEYFRSIDKK